MNEKELKLFAEQYGQTVETMYFSEETKHCYFELWQIEEAVKQGYKQAKNEEEKLKSENRLLKSCMEKMTCCANCSKYPDCPLSQDPTDRCSSWKGDFELSEEDVNLYNENKELKKRLRITNICLWVLIILDGIELIIKSVR